MKEKWEGGGQNPSARKWKKKSLGLLNKTRVLDLDILNRKDYY